MIQKEATFSEKPFWEIKSLQEMSSAEWESLCSRCGICCFHRLTDHDTGTPYYTSIRCNHLNADTLQCNVYQHRFEVCQTCKKIVPENTRNFMQLPDTCGYRTIAEGRDLEWWHPLISRSQDTVHQAGISFLDKEIISEEDMITGDLMKYLIINLSEYLFKKRKC